MSRSVTLVVALHSLVAVSLSTSAAAQIVEMEVEELGTLTDRSAFGSNINGVGDVVGAGFVTGMIGVPNGQPAEPFIANGFFWSQGVITSLGALPVVAGCSPLGCESEAIAVNADGLTVGFAANPQQLPFVWSPIDRPDLGLAAGQIFVLPTTQAAGLALDVNDDGTIVGMTKTVSGTNRTGVMWEYDNGQWTETVLPGIPSAINGKGQIAGQTTTSSFLLLPDPDYGLTAGLHPIPIPGQAGLPRTADINEKGQIVGDDLFSPWLWLPEPDHGLPAGLNFLPRPPPVINDPRISEPGVQPTGLNDSGQIVALIFFVQDPNNPSVETRTVYRDFATQEWIRIDDRIPLDLRNRGWHVRSLAKINDAGQVASSAATDLVSSITGFTTTRPIRITVQEAECQVDLNFDGIVDFQDIQAFFAAYRLNRLSADFNWDGQLSHEDVGVFLTMYRAGCGSGSPPCSVLHVDRLGPVI